ncbi:MAG: MerR family transcriptional regulator [Solirubrobacterales bacterium]
MSDVTEDALTIDQLAQRVGMTVRNIRAHQSRGLLPPPNVKGRTGFYGAEHIARVELIKEMQADGFNLESIKRLLEGANGSSAEVLRFTRALREPFAYETPEIVTIDELTERWQTADPALIRKAEKVGILRPLGDGRFEEMSPRIGKAAAELAELGVPADTALVVAEKLRRHADGVAKEFVKLFLKQVWEPFVEAGQPEERWPEILEALERLRPLAGEALTGMFGLAMTDAVEAAFGREIEKARN